MMTVCQDLWTSGSPSGPIDIDALRRERVGQYFVPSSGAPVGAVAHIVSDVMWGEESAGGTVDVELTVHCRFQGLSTTHRLAASIPPGRSVCPSCAEAECRRLVSEGFRANTELSGARQIMRGDVSPVIGVSFLITHATRSGGCDLEELCIILDERTYYRTSQRESGTFKLERFEAIDQNGCECLPDRLFWIPEFQIWIGFTRTNMTEWHSSVSEVGVEGPFLVDGLSRPSEKETKMAGFSGIVQRRNG